MVLSKVDNSASQDFTLKCSGHLIAMLTQLSILWLNKLVMKVSLPSIEDFLKTLPPFCWSLKHRRAVSFLGICQSLDMNKESYFREQVVPVAKSCAVVSPRCLSQSILSLLDGSRRGYLKGFNKGSEGLSWYKYLLLLSVLLKNSRRGAFQMGVQHLFLEAQPDPQLPTSLINP